jgi:hypothetical protein
MELVEPGAEKEITLCPVRRKPTVLPLAFT